MPDKPIIIDDADKRPPIPARPPHAMISGADWTARGGRRLDWPWHVSAVLGVVVLLFLGFLVYRLDQAVRAWAESGPVAAWLASFTPPAIVGVGLVVLCYRLASWAYYATLRQRGEAYTALLTRTRLGVPIAADVAAHTPWHRIAEAEAQAIELEVKRAPYTRYPLLSTLSEGNKESAETTIYGAGEEPAAPVLPPPGDRLDDYVQRGYIRNSRFDLLIGLGDDKPGDVVEWRWSPDGGASEAVICAVAGAPGGGKTTTASQLIGIALHKRIAIAVCDPQRDSGNPQALTTAIHPVERALLLPVAATDDEIAEAVATVYRIGAAREAGQDVSMAPILLVFDEFSGWLIGNERAKAIVTQLTQIGSRFRKFNIRVLLIGTSWKANLISGELGTTLRSLIRLKVLHGMAAAEASFLTYGMPTDALRAVEGLDIGWAMVYGAGILKRTRVPLIHDLLRDVGTTARRPATALPKAHTNGVEPAAEVSIPPHLTTPNAKIVWLATNTELSTRQIRAAVGCDYNLVVDLVAKVRGPRGAYARHMMNGGS